jgi:hypothetical protein
MSTWASMGSMDLQTDRLKASIFGQITDRIEEENFPLIVEEMS